MRCATCLVSTALVERQCLADILIGDLDHDCIEIATWELIGIGKDCAIAVADGLFASAQQSDDVGMDCGECRDHPLV